MRRLSFIVAIAAALGVFAPSASAQEPSARDSFVDAQGERRDFHQIYDAWFDPSRRRPRYLEALLTNAGLMGFELFLYWWQPDTNFVDWHFPDLGTKLSSYAAPRFDDNLSSTNWVLHPIAGGTHYGFTRANGFGIPASFATAATSSALYEWVWEWHEYPSINDLIVTPLAGMAVGEFFFQLGNYFHSAPPARRLEDVAGAAPLGREIAMGTLGVIHDFGDDDEDTRPILPTDDLGLSTAYWHRFYASLGYDSMFDDRGNRGDAAVLSAGAELAAMPGFLRPGRFGVWFANGNFVSLSLRGSFDIVAPHDIEIDVDAHLFGHYMQDFRPSAGGVRGWARELAVRSSIQYVDRWRFDRHDHYNVLHVLAPVARFWFGRGPLMVRVTGDVSPDFAAPLSLAWEEWRTRFGEEGAKSSLRMHDYYNAWGVSAGAAASIAYRGIGLELKSRFGHYESIDGAEVAEEPVTREVHDVDEIVELGGAFSYTPLRSAVSFGFSAAHVGRVSKMAPITVVRSDERAGVSATFGF